MSNGEKLYIAGMGMVTPVGANVAMTSASVKAGISQYAVSDYYNRNDQPITMASVPDELFSMLEIAEGDRYNERHDRVTRLAILAIQEACAGLTTRSPVPLLLAMPEEQGDVTGLNPFIQNLEEHCAPWVSSSQCRSLHGGRASGIEAIEFAFRYLYELPNDFMLIGGSDSYRDYERLHPLSQEDRLLAPENMDGFAPGEGACFLLLTRHIELALVQDGHIIALGAPGIADEPGHLGSEEPYRGNGLDQAFKKALKGHPQGTIHAIYSSMNGENHWAKEYGVAYMRNQDAFRNPVQTEHPADCFGDLGAATAPALIALAAADLFNRPEVVAHLVYSSSDGPRRGAIVVEKIQLTIKHS